MSLHLVGEPSDDSELTPPTPLDGADVLGRVEKFAGQYLSLPNEHCLPTISLWAAHTYVAEKFYTTPRLICSSAEPESGKTRVLEVLNHLVYKPEMILSPTTAALFRMLFDGPMTLLFDETDTIFNVKNAGNFEDLRGLLNAGYKRGATIPRCVGDASKMRVQRFKVFAPVALAGIAGGMPATITTRAITLHMRKRAAGEHVEPFYEEDAEEEARPIAADLAAWLEPLAEDLGKVRPVMPAGVVDRPAEVWKPLHAIADAAGGEWPDRVREACKFFVLDPSRRPLSLGVRLLGDLREVFTVRDKDGKIIKRHERVRTEEILSSLVAMEEAPWGNLYGKPIDARRLAAELRGYEVLRKTYKDSSGKAVKGYMVAGHADKEGVSVGLGDAWMRYLPAQPDILGNPGNSGNHADQPVTDEEPVTEDAVTADPAVTVLTSEVTAVTGVTEKTGPSVHPNQMQVPGTPPADPVEPTSAKPARRKCGAPGCRKNVPKTARADARFCSPTCRKRANRHKPKDAS
ncbi:DUF3631 domain-containing protein [Nonomuraea sp. CA-218870]|uniref:DUF3631 domain-containing protein n=1 Tax=Nonomuraea sp. CA-218870 TaxID=3239998 RepID=UPI003D93B059